MNLGIIDRVDRMLWGVTTLQCEECGAELHPHTAVWHGQHAYCSLQHEEGDAEPPAFA